MEEGVLLVELPDVPSDMPTNKPFRPKEFLKVSAYPEDFDDEESTMGKMPPSDLDEEVVSVNS